MRDENFPIKERYEDEIDLVELLKILIRNLKLIISVTLIITIIGIGAGFYLKNGEPISMKQRFLINTINNIEGIQTVKIEPQEIFDNDWAVQSFYDDNFFSEFVADEDIKEMRDMRRKLKNIFTIKPLGRDGIEYSISVSNYDMTINQKLVNLYFQILDEYIEDLNIEKVERLAEIANQKVIEYESLLLHIEEEMGKLITNYEGRRNTEGLNYIDEIKERNPRIIAQRDTYSTLYNEVLREKLYLDRVLNGLGSNLTMRSSLYELDSKINMKLIAIISFVLGGFFSIFLIFVKEFIKNVDWKN